MKAKRDSILLRAVRKIGENSVGRCVSWFKQPEVPTALKKDKLNVVRNTTLLK